MHRMNVGESWLKAPNQAVVIQRVAVRGRSTNDGVYRLTEGPHPRTRCGWILGCEGLSRAVTRRTQVLMVMMVRWASRRDSALESLQVTPDTFGEDHTGGRR